MKFDLHTHHERCGHAQGSLREYVEAAIANGLAMIGLSDHSPLFAETEDQPYKGRTMAKSSFPAYVKEMLQLKQEYQDRIEVLAGVESDYFPEHERLYRDIYASYPLDYVIGSVHYMNGSHIFAARRWEDADEEELLRDKITYLQLIQQSARSGLFQILGHIDAIKKNIPAFASIETPALDETLKVIAEHDVAIEVNTSGTYNRCAGWFPDDDILQRACFYGIKVTFGSDAHVPDRVGDQWEQVRQRLREIGFREWAVFRQRKRMLLPL